MPHSQDLLRNGIHATNTINRAELMGVQAWLKQVSQVESPPATTFRKVGSQLLTDSQVTLQSIQKAFKQPAATWLCAHEPLLMDIVANLEALTEAGHNVHQGKLKAHAGVEGGSCQCCRQAGCDSEDH